MSRTCFVTLARFSWQRALCSVAVASCVLALLQFCGPVAWAQSISAQEIAAINRENTERILKSSSYTYRLQTRREGEPARDSTVDHVLRRDGDAFFHLELEANRSAATPDPGAVVRVHAFDGKVLRENEFAYSFADSMLHPGERGGPLMEFFERAIAGDRVAPLDTYSSRPGRKPAGVIANGLRFRQPGDLLNDQYALAAFAFPRGHPPVYYHRILSEFDSEFVRQDGDLITFKCRVSPSPEDLLARHREMTRQLAERAYRQWEATLTFDIGRGCQVTNAVIYDNDAGHVAHELSNVNLAQDPNSGVWYPESYFLVSADKYSFDLAIQSMSFVSAPKEVFSEVFFDQQPIDDEINKQSAFFLLRRVEDYREDAYFNPDRNAHEELLRIARDEILNGTDVVLSEDIAASADSGDDNSPAPSVSTPPVPDRGGRWIQWLVAGLVALAALTAVAISYKIRVRRR